MFAAFCFDELVDSTVCVFTARFNSLVAKIDGPLGVIVDVSGVASGIVSISQIWTRQPGQAAGPELRQSSGNLAALRRVTM
jgi:hypothetical protein